LRGVEHVELRIQASRPPPAKNPDERRLPANASIALANAAAPSKPICETRPIRLALVGLISGGLAMIGIGQGLRLLLLILGGKA